MKVAAALISLITALVGWFYTFYSRAAHRLGVLESERLNARRIILRRVNGMCLFLLAILFFAGFNTVSPENQPAAFVAVWLAVFAVLAVVVGLALTDVRLTRRLHRLQRGGPPAP